MDSSVDLDSSQFGRVRGLIRNKWCICKDQLVDLNSIKNIR